MPAGLMMAAEAERTVRSGNGKIIERLIEQLLTRLDQIGKDCASHLPEAHL